MARKIKFALEMKDGVKVRSNLEELRENFDLEKAVGYFLSGKLTEWLDDRYYEEEAEKLEAIDKDAPDLRARLCEALGVECEDEAELDVEQLARLNEKKAVLRQKTSDESIISNADKTALTQEDLADLLDMDESVIYLCGDSFNVPARVKNKKYVGVLGTPTISIKANSRKELDEKGIVFENVKLPWGEQKAEVTDGEKKSCPKCGAGNAAEAKFCNTCGASMDDVIQKKSEVMCVNRGKSQEWKKEKMEILDNLFKTIFVRCDQWLFLKRGYGDSQKLDNPSIAQKGMCVKLVCKNQYSADDIVHMCMDIDFTVGWALTYDSFCVGGRAGNHIIKYKDITSLAVPDNDTFVIRTKDFTFKMNGSDLDSNVVTNVEQLKTFLTSAAQFAKLDEGNMDCSVTDCTEELESERRNEEFRRILGIEE